MAEQPTEEQRAAYIAALVRERDGYVARGETKRAQGVGDELRRLGHDAAPPAKRAERRSAK